MNTRRILTAALIPFVLLVMLGFAARALQSAEPPSEKVLIEESFADSLSKDWTWLREIPRHWKIDKERKELLISPVWSEGNLTNIPFRQAPDIKDGPLAIEVHIDHEPKGDYEYAALIWYFDDKNFVAIRKGPHGEDGIILSLVRKKEGKGDGPLSAPKIVIFKEPSVDLRMVITETKAQGWYRATSADPWQSLGEAELPTSGSAKIGFRTGNGEADKPSWARFSKFRILQLER